MQIKKRPTTHDVDTTTVSAFTERLLPARQFTDPRASSHVNSFLAVSRKRGEQRTMYKLQRASSARAAPPTGTISVRQQGPAQALRAHEVIQNSAGERAADCLQDCGTLYRITHKAKTQQGKRVLHATRGEGELATGVVSPVQSASPTLLLFCRVHPCLSNTAVLCCLPRGHL